MNASTPAAYELFHQGTLALAEIEAAGIRVDVDYLDRATQRTTNRIAALEEKLRRDDVFRVWRREFGEKTNLGSREQLTQVIFRVLGHKYKGDKTSTGRFKADEEVLLSTGLKFAKRFVLCERLKKMKATYLDGLKREVVDGRVHPFFNLHTVETYRSSANSPNIQNVIIRLPKMGEIIRRCYIPSDGCVFVEIDYAALEFRIAACFWKDPVMVRYASDPAKDIHRDQAAEIFLCSKEEAAQKQVRYVAKNQFVFPILYGSYHVQCAKNIWEHMDSRDLAVGGLPMKAWLAKQGISERGACDPKEEPIKGSFEHHIREVERRFMGRFKVFAESKERWYDEYRRRIGFPLMTGFWCGGLYTRNECMNTPIQGPAFHCLLWSLIRQLRKLKKRQMRSKVVAEVHDSTLGDVPLKEVQDYINMAKKIMTVDIRRAWPWIIVPLSVEVEIGRANWWAKEKWEERGGVWRAAK